MENNSLMSDQPSSSPAPISNPSPANNQWLWPVIVSGVVLVLLIAGGLWWWMSDVNPVSTPTPSATISPDLSSWKTYRDDKNGFEFKYPREYVFVGSPIVNDGHIKDANGKSLVYLGLYLRDLNSEYSDSLSKEIEAVAGDVMDGQAERLDFKKISTPQDTLAYFSKWKITLNNGDVYYRTRADFELVSQKTTNQYGQFKTVVYLEVQNDLSDLKIFDQILSTFKFDDNSTVEYKNSEYGFSLSLPATWKGYTVEKESWGGSYLDRISDGPMEFGPQIIIKNPKGEKWQFVSIMVFTPEQWQLVVEEKLGVSAAPIGPSKLGQNAKYVFVLPPRWVGFTDLLGQEEALAITKTFKAY